MRYTYWKQLKEFLGLTNNKNTSGSPLQRFTIEAKKKKKKENEKER